MKTKSDGGSTLILILVLAAILVTATTGVVFLYRVNSRFAKNYLDEAQALYLAEGGLSMAEAVLWQNPQHRDLLTGDLSTGTYRALFRDDQERIEQHRLTLPVEATGYAGTAKQTLVQFFTLEPYPKHPAFNYSLFQSSGLTELSLGHDLEIVGDIFANGNVSVSSEAIVMGTIYAVGDVFCEQEEFPQPIVTGTIPLDLPSLDWDLYESMATTVISGPAYIGHQEANEAIVFVTGDATLAGDLPSGTTVITSGKLTVSMGVDILGMVLLIGGEGIELHGHSSLTATLYSPSTVTFLGPIDFTGTIVAPVIHLHPESKLSYLDPAMVNLRAPLPGLTITKSSWYQKYFVPVSN